MDSSELSLLWRVRKTVNSMLQSRGYVLSRADLDLDLEEFRRRFGDPSAAGGASSSARRDLTILCSHRLDSSQQLFVFWAEEEKIGVKPIKHFVSRMEQERIHRAVLILKRGITPFARRIVQEMAHPADSLQAVRVIELFEDVELLVDITRHAFVPQHILLSEDEKRELLQRYKLRESQLPRMQQLDPVARYLGLSKGQVVKIIRPSETAGRYVTYRLVA